MFVFIYNLIFVCDILFLSVFIKFIKLKKTDKTKSKNKMPQNEDSLSIFLENEIFNNRSEQVIQSKVICSPERNYNNYWVELDNLQRNKVLNTMEKNELNSSENMIDSNDQQKKSQLRKSKTVKKGEQNKKYSLLEKRKENSRNYRQRKKQYFTKLQEENKYYKKKTIELEQRVIQLQTQLNQIKYSSEDLEKQGYETSYEQDLHSVLQRLKSNKIEKEQQEGIVEYMKSKHGPAGTDRTKVLNYYMSEYINNSLADFQKYIIQCAYSKTGVFGQIKTKLDEKVHELLNLNQEKKKKMDTNQIEIIHNEAAKYMYCCRSIYKNYIQLLQQANKIQGRMKLNTIFQDIEKLVSMALWFNKNKHRTELRKLRAEWFRSFTGENV